MWLIRYKETDASMLEGFIGDCSDDAWRRAVAVLG